MNYDFSQFDARLANIEKWLTEELSGIRTGRASTALIEKIQVDSYGTKVPLNQVASLTIEDARTIRIAPWDKDSIVAIQSALTQAQLGVSVSVDDAGVRVAFPELTQENRTMLGKLVGERVEKAKVSVRKDREDVWNNIQKKEKGGEISEDDKFRFKDELQKKIDAHIEKFDAMREKKLTELEA